MTGAAESSVDASGGASTLLELVEVQLRRHSERPHIRLIVDEDQEQVLTFGQLDGGAAEVAAGLARHDVVGQTVAIMLPTGADFFFAFLGVLRAGGIPVPIYPPANPAAIEDHVRRQSGILANSLSATLLVDPLVRPVAGMLKRRVGTLERFLTVEEVRSASASSQSYVPNATDTALIQYTSGSTGQPKGVVLTHAHIMANLRAMDSVAEVTADDVFVSWLPLYHDMGLIGAWLGMLYCGAQLAVMSPLDFLKRPSRWLQAMARYRGTLSASPNFGYERCIGKITDAELEGIDLSSWRHAFNGAEMVHASTIRRFNQRFGRYGFPGDAMRPVYGLAECALGVAFPRDREVRVDRVERRRFTEKGVAAPAGEEEPLELVGCGGALPGYQIRVVGENREPLPERREGRIEIRGPSVMTEYFRNDEATHAVLHDGWLDSGDLGYLADGELFVSGRAKDVIIRAGQNVYPDELEEAVGMVAGVRKGGVAAFGAADPRTGSEQVVIAAETRHRRKPMLQRLRSEIRQAALRKTGSAPDQILLLQPRTIPKTSSGKIQHRRCRMLYEQGELGKPVSSRSRTVVALLKLRTEELSQRLGKWLHLTGARR